MENILIIKTGAFGDVVRTTVLLHLFKGNIYWITDSYNIPLFPDDFPNLKLISSDDLPESLFTQTFDLVINLEEDIDLARMLSTIKSERIIGTYWGENSIHYTENSAAWFDMSLISVYSKEKADKIKLDNKLSYQEILYGMLGESFQGETYQLYKTNLFKPNRQVIIGLEKNVGTRWPNKQWYGYNQLAEILQAGGLNSFFFEHRKDLRKYMRDIEQCSLVITGDTLAMHIALAYQIPCIAIFNCTSPNEIYDYGILTKMVSPMLKEVYYKTVFNPAAISAIRVEEVEKKVKELLMK